MAIAQRELEQLTVTNGALAAAPQTIEIAARNLTPPTAPAGDVARYNAQETISGHGWRG